MFYDYYNYHFWGMHLIWWIIWMILILYIFATPYSIPGERTRKDKPLDLLKKRYAAGEIKTEEYHEMKKNLEV